MKEHISCFYFRNGELEGCSYLMKIGSGKEIKFTQGLLEHAAFLGKFRAMFPKLIKLEQVQKLKDI